MRKLVLQNECGVVKKMIDGHLLPGDLTYPVCLVNNQHTQPPTLVVADANHREWTFEI